MPFDDIEDCVFADPQVTRDPAVAAPFPDSNKDFRRKPVRFGSFPRLTTKFLPRARAAARPDFTRSLIRSRSN
tara:strand:- start:846 stop:1064 length:219 start_codon:yes stop_codon:yes gene_type:complete